MKVKSVNKVAQAAPSKQFKSGTVEKNIYVEVRSGSLRFAVEISPIPKTRAPSTSTNSRKACVGPAVVVSSYSSKNQTRSQRLYHPPPLSPLAIPLQTQQCAISSKTIVYVSCRSWQAPHQTRHASSVSTSGLGI